MNCLRSALFITLATFCFSNSNAQIINHWESPVLAGDTWKWLEPTGTITGWTDTTYDDSAWGSGPGGMGYGDGDDGTTIPGTISVYMRKTFTVTDTSKLLYAVFNADYDDGFVAYLNGVEIARSYLGVGGSTVLFNQPADGLHEAQVYSGGDYEYYAIDKAT